MLAFLLVSPDSGKSDTNNFSRSRIPFGCLHPASPLNLRPEFATEVEETPMKLSDVFLRGLKSGDSVQKHFDGGGLYLHVSSTGGKLWRMAYHF